MRKLDLLGAVGCSLAVAACGSSSGSSNGSSGAGDVAGIKFADCMRAHGVPNFPDPAAGGGVQIPNGVNPQSPAFEAAQGACQKLMPGPGSLGGHVSETRKLAMLRLARCMRSHGLSTFPDPTTTAPAPGTSFGLAFGRPGSFIAVPQTMLQSPAFKQAATACGFPGAGHGGGGKRTFIGPGG